jgi:aminomethyltransferase
MAERSPLHDVTAAAGAVFTDSAGWDMPARYGDVRAEYGAARQGAALFDLSHRGKVEVAGGDAGTFLHNLTTNDIKGLAVSRPPWRAADPSSVRLRRRPATRRFHPS